MASQVLAGYSDTGRTYATNEFYSQKGHSGTSRTYETNKFYSLRTLWCRHDLRNQRILLSGDTLVLAGPTKPTNPTLWGHSGTGWTYETNESYSLGTLWNWQDLRNQQILLSGDTLVLAGPTKPTNSTLRGHSGAGRTYETNESYYPGTLWCWQDLQNQRILLSGYTLVQ